MTELRRTLPALGLAFCFFYFLSAHAQDAPVSPAPETPKLKLLARPYDFYAGLSLGYETYNATDAINGGQASLTGITSGIRIGAVRTLATVEHRFEIEARYVTFPAIAGSRLTNLNQNLYPGINWQMKFLSENALNFLVGANADSILYFSTLDGTAVKLDGTLSLMPFGGARYNFNRDILKYVDAHVGIDFPLSSGSYRPSMGIWQRLRMAGQIPWGETSDRWLEGWIDVVHSGETTNLENQTQLSLALWIFAKWKLDPEKSLN